MQVETAYGPFEVVAQNAHTLYMTSDALAINGVPHRISQHMTRHNDGSWHNFSESDRWAPLYLRRTDRYPDDPSDSAYEKMLAELERIAAEFPADLLRSTTVGGVEMRTSKAEVQAVFALLCETVGVPQGGKFDQGTRSMSRGWSLDHNPTYGGWIVRGHSGSGTGESNPLSEYRMSSGEFVRCMHFAIRAVEIARTVGES